LKGKVRKVKGRYTITSGKRTREFDEVYVITIDPNKGEVVEEDSR